MISKSNASVLDLCMCSINKSLSQHAFIVFHEYDVSHLKLKKDLSAVEIVTVTGK